MDCSVGADKGKGVAHHVDHKGQAVGSKASVVDKRGEDVVGAVVRAEDDERDQDGKEADDMQDQDQALELGQRGADQDVDKDGKQKDPHC